MKRVLIVDDEKEIFLFLRRIVENKFGFEAVWAENGLKAIQELEKSVFDLVIFDVNMPIMGGVAAIKVIRQNKEFDAMPILMCSSESDKEIIKDLISFNITNYMLKPISYEEAIKKIGKIFNEIELKTEIGKKAEHTILLALSDLKKIQKLHEIFGKILKLQEANSGADALSVYIDRKPDIVIIGDNLGLIDSLMLAQKIKEKDFQTMSKINDQKALTTASKIIYFGSKSEYSMANVFDKIFNSDEEMEFYLKSLLN